MYYTHVHATYIKAPEATSSFSQSSKHDVANAFRSGGQCLLLSLSIGKTHAA